MNAPEWVGGDGGESLRRFSLALLEGSACLDKHDISMSSTIWANELLALFKQLYWWMGCSGSTRNAFVLGNDAGDMIRSLALAAGDLVR